MNRCLKLPTCHVFFFLLFCMFFSIRHRGRNWAPKGWRRNGARACARAYRFDVCVLCSVVQQRDSSEFFHCLCASCSAFSSTSSAHSLVHSSFHREPNVRALSKAQSVDTRRNSKFYSVHLKFFIGNVHTHFL